MIVAFGLRRRAALAAVLVGFLGLGPACAGQGGSKRAQRVRRADLQAQLQKLEDPGLVLGEFPLESVVDGDTVRVGGLDSSLRLLGIDTEETFKSEPDRRLFEAGWAEYLRTKRGKSKHPVKMATPLGEEAKDFAKKFFADSPRVRLERDHPLEIRDVYNRYLTYIFAFKNGKWVNYNVECVRAGMSPYFSKYGYSRRYHQAFVDAQTEARLAKVGIWSADGQHYPDYDERLVWWNARAEFAKKMEEEYAQRKDFVVLTHWDAILKLERLEGKEVTVLGIVNEVRLGDRGPSTVAFSRKRGAAFSLVFWDKDVFGSSRVAAYKGEFIKAVGKLSRYRRKDGSSQLQMVINLPGQVSGRDMPGMPPLFPEDNEDAVEVPAATPPAPQPAPQPAGAERKGTDGHN